MYTLVAQADACKLLNHMHAHVRAHVRTCAHVAQSRASSSVITEHAQY